MKKKLRLDLYALEVVSFDTSGRGVRAHESTELTVCGADTCDCDNTGQQYCADGTLFCTADYKFTCLQPCVATQQAPGNTCYETCGQQGTSCICTNGCTDVSCVASCQMSCPNCPV